MTLSASCQKTNRQLGLDSLALAGGLTSSQTVLQVTHESFRKPGGLKCPKCMREALEGNGLRQETRTILHLEGQEEVFTWGMTCVGCPGHTAAGG
jgi:hypothetical protein